MNRNCAGQPGTDTFMKNKVCLDFPTYSVFTPNTVKWRCRAKDCQRKNGRLKQNVIPTIRSIHFLSCWSDNYNNEQSIIFLNLFSSFNAQLKYQKLNTHIPHTHCPLNSISKNQHDTLFTHKSISCIKIGQLELTSQPPHLHDTNPLR
jgi:hypothetical protein